MDDQLGGIAEIREQEMVGETAWKREVEACRVEGVVTVRYPWGKLRLSIGVDL